LFGEVSQIQNNRGRPIQPGCTSTKRFFGVLMLTMTHYGPARVSALGDSDITRRRLSNQGKR
jgi:hypothetical protein